MTVKRTELHALLGWERIRAIMRDFYRRVAADTRLAPFFAEVADLDETAERIARFWWRDLGGRPRVAGEVFNPHAVHRRFGVTPEAVDAWLEVFEATLRDHLPPPLTEPWMARARTFADWTRIEMARGAPPRRRPSARRGG